MITALPAAAGELVEELSAVVLLWLGAEEPEAVVLLVSAACPHGSDA